MPDQLTTAQLEAIQRLIIEPLRCTVRAEMQSGHDRLTAAIEKVASRLANHTSGTLAVERSLDRRLTVLESRVAVLERFRARVLIVYGALTVLFSFLWSFVRDWIVGRSR